MTKPLGKEVIKEYSIGNKRGIDKMIKPIIFDFFKKTKSEIKIKGKIDNRLLMIGNALKGGILLKFKGIANNASNIVL